eukprot:Ihof_evm17s46 gene=Ihof_evmTU17s46
MTEQTEPSHKRINISDGFCVTKLNKLSMNEIDDVNIDELNPLIPPVILMEEMPTTT